MKLVWYDVTDRSFGRQLHSYPGYIGLKYIYCPGLPGYTHFRKECIKMKRIIPVVVALLLIVIIGGVYFGEQLWDKYSYGKELADLDEYYGVTGSQLAIILQDEMVEEKAVVTDGAVYFDLDTVHKYINEGFYADFNEQKLLYTTAVDTAVAMFGQTGYGTGEGDVQTAYKVCYMDGEKLYVAAEYVRKFTNYEYFWYDRHLQVYTEWGIKEIMTVSRSTQVRTLGGIKSPILRELEQGETVELLKQMDTWSLVKTSDSVIGYVENKRLTNLSTDIETPVTDCIAPEYTTVAFEGKVSLGWHSIGGVGGNATLDEMLSECGNAINVIAPTWFSLSDDLGGFISYGETSYVEKAHKKDLQVWGTWDNFNYANSTQTPVSTYQVLSNTTVRQQLAESIVSTSLELGLDGVNIDFEGLTQDSGEHFIQFLRELSVLCRESGLVLSVDNYVPFNYNEFYRLDIQGQILDYVIIMGYDEHWSGSKDPGSVASIGYVSNGLTKTLEQVPADKVVNALPFYTILWKTEGTDVTDQYITLKNMDSYLQRVGAEPQWDEEVGQYYAEWQDGSVTCQIWVEDEKSIREKLSVMNAQRIGGVAVWQIGYGNSKAWELIRSYSGL